MESPSSSDSGANEGSLSLSEPDAPRKTLASGAATREEGAEPSHAVQSAEAAPVATRKKRTKSGFSQPSVKKSRTATRPTEKETANSVTGGDFVNEVIRLVQLKEFQNYSREVHPGPQNRDPANVVPFVEWVKKDYPSAGNNSSARKPYDKQRYDLVAAAIYQATLPGYSTVDHACNPKFNKGDEAVVYFHRLYLKVKVDSVLEPRLNRHSGRVMPVYKVQETSKTGRKNLEELFEVDMWPAAPPVLRSFQALLAHRWNQHSLRDSGELAPGMFHLTAEAEVEEESRWMKESSVPGALCFRHFLFDVIGQDGYPDITFVEPDCRFYWNSAEAGPRMPQIPLGSGSSERIAFACKGVSRHLVNGEMRTRVEWPDTLMRREDQEDTGVAENGWTTAAALRTLMEKRLHDSSTGSSSLQRAE